MEHLVEYGLPPGRQARHFDVGTIAFIDSFSDEVLDGIVALGGSTFRIFEGAYGSGKSHLVQLIEDAGLSRGYAVVRIDLSEGLTLRNWDSITRFILENLVIVAEGEETRGIFNILERMGTQFSLDTRAFLDSTLPHPGFKAAMSKALESEGLSVDARKRLGNFLHGQRVAAYSLRQVGIDRVKEPLSGRNSELVLQTILSGLHLLGLSGTILLFDENEKTFSKQRPVPMWVRTTANRLRRLIDACFNGGLVGTAVVFTVLPEFLGDASLAYPALGERLRLVRTGPYPFAWRWPVLPIEEINQSRSPDEFLSGAVDMFTGVVKELDGTLEGCECELFEEGQTVLEQNAGTGYRREMMKRLAAVALDRV